MIRLILEYEREGKPRQLVWKLGVDALPSLMELHMALPKLYGAMRYDMQHGADAARELVAEVNRETGRY